jgi:hypothetical protein
VVKPFLSPYFAVNELPGIPVLRIVRSPRAFPSLEDLSEAWDDLNRALDGIDRGRFSLLMDIRLVTGRNDPNFEQTFARHRREVERGFSKVAVLVSTPAGVLQVHRHAIQDGVPMKAFMDPPKAIDWLLGAQTRQPHASSR